MLNPLIKHPNEYQGQDKNGKSTDYYDLSSLPLLLHLDIFTAFAMPILQLCSSDIGPKISDSNFVVFEQKLIVVSAEWADESIVIPALFKTHCSIAS